MEIEQEILKRKEIQSHLLDFIKNDDDDKNNFEIFKDLIKSNNISQNEEDFHELLDLISVILTNHYRSDTFFSKIYKILDFILELPDIQTNMPKTMIYKNKMLTLYFLKKGIPLSKLEGEKTKNGDKFNILGEDIDMEYMYISHENRLNPYNIMYLYYYYYVNNKNKEKQDQIANEIIPKKFNMDLNTLQRLCEKGENENDLCILIRQDNLNEFIHYANINNVDFNSQTPISTVELQSKNIFNLLCNSYAAIRDSTLIEYAAYHGSIQIFKYLFLNGAKLSSNILKYAVHGCNSEIIHIIEENSIVDETQIKESLIEAIKCHHNDIARYFESCCRDLSKEIKDKILETASEYHNYEFMTTDIDELLTDTYQRGFLGKILALNYPK